MADGARFCSNGVMLPDLTRLLADLVRLPSVNPMGRTDLPADILYESRVGRHLEHEIRHDA